MNPPALVLGSDTDPYVDGLPGPHSQRWWVYWTPDKLMDALETTGIDPDTAAGLVRKYPEERVKAQLRALCCRYVRVSRALTLIEAIRNNRVLPSWMRDEKELSPKSDYRGPYSTAKPWLETQSDIAALLRKNGSDGVQWGVSERRQQASLMFEKTIAENAIEKLLNVRIDMPLPEDIGERNAAFRALYHYLKSKFDVIAFRFSDGSTMFDFESQFRTHLTTQANAGELPAIGVSKALALPTASEAKLPAFAARVEPGDLPISDASTPDRPRLKQIDQLLVRLLRDVGVLEWAARDLVARHRDRCEVQLAALPFRWKLKSRADYIVRAIEEDAGIPPRIGRLLQRMSDEREFDEVPESVRYQSELIVDEMIQQSGTRVPAAAREALEQATILGLAGA
jgi:hypothetical protein